jgi:SsrA-binding protein
MATVEPKVAAENRRARYDYFIEDTVEAGIMLVGTEVKALREGRADMTDAHALERGGEMFLVNFYIPEYRGGNQFNHEPKRDRKLLLHRREIDKLANAVNRAGYTIVPLKLYFNERGYAKVLLGLARGKKQHDKRATIKDRDWKRDQARIMRGRN